MNSLNEKVILKIEEIYDCINCFIESEQQRDYELSLMEGKPGAALFLYQYARYKPEQKEVCYEKINALMEHAFDYIQETPDVKTSYCDGISGLLWLIEYFRSKQVIEMDDEDIPADMIQELSSYSISQTVDHINCDLLHGGFGFWAFLLESKSLPNKKKLIRDQLDALHKITIDTTTGRNWKIDTAIFKNKQQDQIDPLTSVHFGLAHGICSILILLAKTKLQGYFEAEAEEHIHKGLSLIKSFKLTNTTSYNLYPMMVVNGKNETNSRLAWCNGDLCIAHAFWMGWKSTNREEYKQEAMQLITVATELNTQEAGVLDAGLCHGAAGLAQIFSYYYKETKIVNYKLASEEWIKSTLELATYPDGLAGYKTFSSETYGGPRIEYGLLSGVTGIGLALLSYIMEGDDDWDKVLQMY